MPHPTHPAIMLGLSGCIVLPVSGRGAVEYKLSYLCILR